MSTQANERIGVPVDTFELRLVIARMHAGRITAEDAAALVGVSGQTWRNWESGQAAGARKEAMLRHIARQLEVDYQWLRDGGPLAAGDPLKGGPARLGSRPTETYVELFRQAA